jgi:hypothetical protein
MRVNPFYLEFIMSNLNSYRIHTSIVSAAAIKAVGEIQVSKKWNETTKQTAKERSVLIPFEVLKAPEVPESFRALVESALMSQATEVLKAFCDENPNSFEVSSELFTRTNLVESFLTRGENWMTKTELEVAFKASATWKKFISDERFQSNQAYKNAVSAYWDSILKLSGKNVSFTADKCDGILSRIQDDDLETEVGQFIVKRVNAIRAKSSEAIDFDAL